MNRYNSGLSLFNSSKSNSMMISNNNKYNKHDKKIFKVNTNNLNKTINNLNNRILSTYSNKCK